MDEIVRQHLEAGRRREAFEVLVAALEEKVFRLACSMLGDEGLAEDAAQEAFLRVWRALPGFEGRSSISTWVYAITRNVCLTRAKRRRSELALAPESGEGTWQGAPEKRRALDLDLAVSRLPEPYQQVLRLFYYEDRSHQDMAAMLAMPVSTVKTHLHRARRQLREMLEEQGSSRWTATSVKS